MPFLRHALPFFTLLTLLLPAQASTITGTVQSAAGAGRVTSIVFAPLSTPVISSDIIVTTTQQTATSDSSGAFSIVLTAGDYRVTVGGRTQDSFLIAVPNDDEIYPLTELISVFRLFPSYVLRIGDTMSGFLTLSGAPTNTYHAATKGYVDEVAAAVISGETNTASNVGDGHGIFKAKEAFDLQLRSIVAGANITIVSNASDITIIAAAGGSPPTGTGFRHVTSSVEDLTSKLVDTADVTDAAITYAKIQNISATDKLLGRSTAGAGSIEEIALTSVGRALLDDSTTSAQRTTLGLAIGTDVQGYDPDLAALANNSTDGLLTHTAAGTASARTITAGIGVAVSNGSGVSGNPTLSHNVEAGANIALSTNGSALVIATTGAVGEINTGSNLGTSSATIQPIFKAKSSLDLTFRQIEAGANITLTSNANTLTIASLIGTIPTGTGFPHITAGSQDAAAKTVDTSDITAAAVSYAKIQNVSATDKVLGRSTSGAGVIEEIALTSAGRALIDDADAAAQRTTLGLGALALLATVPTASIDNDAVTYAKIQNVSATDKVLGRSTSGAGDVEEIAMTAAGRALVDDADATAQRTTLGLGPLALKTTIATADIDNDAVTYARIQDVSATDMLLGRSTAGSGIIEEIPLTAAGRALIDDASATAQRTTLGLGAVALLATVATANVDNDAITYAKIQNVSATDKVLGRSTSGAGDIEEIALTAAGRALIDDTTAAAQRITLGIVEALIIPISGETTVITTGTAKFTFRMPYAMTLTAVRTSLKTAQSTGPTYTIDILEAGTTILSTLLTLDNTEKTSTTAAAPAVISDTALADDAEITFSVTQVGDGTAAGGKVYLIGYR
jgi:hypothetical protein